MPAYTLLATQHPLQENLEKPGFTAVILIMIRLEEQKSDLLITINIPHVPGDYSPSTIKLAAGKWGPLIEAGFDARTRILQSLDVKDWGLFSSD